MTRKRRRKLSRRQFIKGGVAAGLATTFPRLLLGCGESEVVAPAPTPTPVGAPREHRTLHFDLSGNGMLGDAFLMVLNSASYRTRLQPHNAASRARFRERVPELRLVPDGQLTHYVEDVDLPADALQLVTVFGTANNEPALLGAYVNIPSSTLLDYATRAVNGEAALPLALMKRYQTPNTVEGLAGLLRFNNAYVNPLTTAVALCFHHPEVMNLNTTLGATTLIGRVQNLPASAETGYKYVDNLARFIGEHLPATTTAGGWATVVPQTYANGQPVLDQNGNQVYRYDLSDGTHGEMAQTVQEALKSVFDDPHYEGSNWNATKGLANVDQTPAAGARAMPALVEDDAFIVQASLPVGTTHNGIDFVSLTVPDPTTRSVQLTIKNRYLRWLRAYAQYFTPEGTPLPVVNPDDDDTTRAKFITEITSNNQIMGIPLMGNDVSSTNIEFELPAAASKARIIIGSLGTGGEAFCPEAVVGSALTLAFNIGVPTILLALGIGETGSQGLSVLAENFQLRSVILSTFRTWLRDSAPSYAVGIYGSDTSQDATCFITAAANTIIQALLEGAPIFVRYLATQGSLDALLAVPFVGWILKGLEIAAALAAIAVTVGEVVASKALTYNDITLSFDIQVTIHHDTQSSRFPPEADLYEVTATLNKSQLYKLSGPVASSASQDQPPIVTTIKNVPSGGTVTIDVVLKSSTGWIAATATIGPLAATPEAAGAVDLTVTDKLVPLSAQTQYQHDLKLESQNGAHIWTKTTAPTATVAALACATNETLCALGQLTISPRTGMVGYAWRTGGLSVAQCNGGPAGVLFAFQNVANVTPPPDNGLKFSSCGFTFPAGLTYDPGGPPSGVGNNFYFAPAADGNGYYLRSVTLDTTTPFDLQPATNWGRFTQILDSIATHPTGYVVGVATGTHKMEILELPDSAVADAMPALAPWATMRSGKGTRPGLMDTPIAVAVANGALIVLEQGNLRLQAFDLAANPIDYFANKATPFAPLINESGSVVYVDLGTDSIGYLYVLSYVNNGATPADYRLDIYDPDGTFLVRTTGIAAGGMKVSPFRTVYTLNYESVAGAARVEPSLSQWLPSTPGT